jgi:hypothetical protein
MPKTYCRVFQVSRYREEQLSSLVIPDYALVTVRVGKRPPRTERVVVPVDRRRFPQLVAELAAKAVAAVGRTSASGLEDGIEELRHR